MVDDGAARRIRTTRGGIIIRADDFNPERVFLDDTLVSGGPARERRRRLHTPIGRRSRLQLRQLQARRHRALSRRVDGGLRVRCTTAAGDRPSWPWRPSTSRTSTPTIRRRSSTTLARPIVTNLQSPDIVALEEIQDNNGADRRRRRRRRPDPQPADRRDRRRRRPDVRVAPDQPGQRPGRRRARRQHPRRLPLPHRPRARRSSTAPGGNADHAAAVVDGRGRPAAVGQPRAGSTRPTRRWTTAASRWPASSPSAARRVFVDRQPLQLQGRRPAAVRPLPAAEPLVSEVQRHQQAHVVNDFVDAILAVDPAPTSSCSATSTTSSSPSTLPILDGGGVLDDLITTLPADRALHATCSRATRRSLDHILVSRGLRDRRSSYDVVHINAEFADQASDHDPQVVRFLFNPLADLARSRAVEPPTSRTRRRGSRG